MTDGYGWVEDATLAPHRVLGTPLGIDLVHGAALVPVGGRPALVVAGMSGVDRIPLTAVDLDTGAVIPDRSRLHGRVPHAVGLGSCGDRAVVAVAASDGAVHLRDALTGEPFGAELRGEMRKPRLPKAVHAIAIASVGGQPIVATAGDVVLAWDPVDGTRLARHELSGRAFVEHQDRLLVVATVRDDALRLHDVLTGEPFGEPFPGHGKLVAGLEFDGRLLVASYRPDQRPGEPIRVWDVAASAEITLPALLGHSDADLEGADIAGLALDELDGRVAAVVLRRGSGLGEAWLPAADGRRRVALGTQRANLIGLGRLGGYLTAVMAGEDSALALYDVATGHAVPSPYYGGRLRGEPMCGAVVGARGVALLGAPPRMWDLEAGRPVLRLGFGDEIEWLTAGELYGRAVFAVVTGRPWGGAGPYRLRIWDPQTVEVITEIDLDAVTEDGSLGACAGPVFTEYAGQTVVALAVGAAVHLWDARTGAAVGKPYRGHGTTIWALAAGRMDGRPTLASGDSDATVRVWDPAIGADVAPPVPSQHGLVTALAFGELDGRTVLVTGGEDRTVRVWDAASGAAVGLFWTGHRDKVNAVLVTRWRDKPVVVSTADRGEPRLWMLDAPAPDTGHTNSVRSMAAGVRYGRPVFASGSEDRTIRLWDAATGRLVGAPIAAHDGTVRAVAFGGPGREILISGGADGVVQRWDPRTGERIGAPLCRLAQPVVALATAELDTRVLVAAAGQDMMLRVWDSATGKPYAELPIAGRNVRSVDLAVLDGRLVALTTGDTDAGEHSDDTTAMAALWDVSSGVTLYEPTLLPTAGDVGAFGTLDGQLVVAHGIDAEKNPPDNEWYWPEEAADLTVRDVATRELISVHQHEGDFNYALTVASVAERSTVFCATGTRVVAWDAATGVQAGPDYRRHVEPVVCLAVTEVDGRTVVASGDVCSAVHVWDFQPLVW